MFGGTVIDKEQPTQPPNCSNDSTNMIDPLPGGPMHDITKQRIEEGYTDGATQIGGYEFTALIGRYPLGGEDMHGRPGQTLLEMEDYQRNTLNFLK